MGQRTTNPGQPPQFVAPMLAKRVTVLPEGPNWSYEIKFDGYRMPVIKSVNRLLSRNHGTLNDRLKARPVTGA